MKRKDSSFRMQCAAAMLGFFAMSFVDCVGTATNYLKDDLHLSNTLANLCPSMVFFWFLVCAVPLGIWMNKIGRRKTVLAGLGITLAAVVLPLLYYHLAVMMLSFALLGLGNAALQTSLNPLVSNIVRGEKLASFMTAGQFVKAVGSFSAPVLAAWFAAAHGQWTLLYAVFSAEGLLALAVLARTEIREEKVPGGVGGFKGVFALLGDRGVLLYFIGIVCHVGIDVGVNTAAPQIFMERLDWPLSRAIYAASVYFMFRTAGCFLGTFLLAKFSSRKVFFLSTVLLLAALCGLLLFRHEGVLYGCVALAGLGNSNIFSIVFSQALLHNFRRENEVSGLMITGLVGGAVLPLLMGVASDGIGAQAGAVLVMTAAAAYLIFLTRRINSLPG